MSHVDDGTLNAYLDGELPPVERARLEAHVAECPACRTRLDEERALVERASGLLGLAQPPERAVPPLHQLRRARLAWRLRVPLTWAATVLLALGLGYYAGERGSDRGSLGAPALRQMVADSATRETANAVATRDNAAAGSATLERRQAVAQSRPPAAAPAAKQAEREPAMYVDGINARALPDTAAPAAGVVAIQPQNLRPRPTPVPTAKAPEPLAMAEAVVTSGREESGVAAARGRLVATEWQIIRRGPAREILGTDPVGIPGLAVRNIRRSPTGDVVVVEQAIDSATVIRLFQQRLENDQFLRRGARSDAPKAAVPPPAPQFGLAGTERLARFIGGVRVEIAGPLSTDSLNRLLEQVQPIGP